MLFDFFRLVDNVVGSVLIVLFTTIGRIFSRKHKIPKNILIIRLWGMGDAVVSLPVVKALKDKYPDAKVDVLCRYRTQAPYENQDFIDHIELFEPENILSLFFKFGRYDLVVDLEQYLNLSGLVSWWLGKRRIGFDHGVRRLCYTDTINYSHERHMLKNYLLMTKIVGADHTGNKLLPLKVKKTDMDYVGGYMKSLKLSDDDFKIGICCTVAESGKTRLWDNKKWAVLCDQLVKKYDAKIVFIGGRAGKTTHEMIMGLMKEPAVDAYETSIRQAFALMGKLDFMISLDTGPMHVSAAQQVPTVGVFGPNTPLVWMPFGSKNKAVYKKVPCSPCIINKLGQTPPCFRVKDKNLCMTSIQPVDILKVVDSML